MKKDESLIEIKTQDGKTIQGEILFHFEANGDNFVLYEAEEQLFAAKIDENKNLTPVEEDEWPMVEKIYNQFMEDYENEEEDDE
ncbi:MAG: DUF1292 domain-containing protein [Mycoplasmataceae bacterium]|nr:DUF1292 domain-containing protein [Mycoplasmataceae bacterium]